MNLVIKIALLLLCIFSYTSIFSQKSEDIELNKKWKITPVQYSSVQMLNLGTDYSIDSTQIIIPSIFNFNKLPTFCKLEYFVEKQSNMPIKFRLGSVDYVNKLESK